MLKLIQRPIGILNIGIRQCNWFMAKSELFVEKINLLFVFVESDIAISIVNCLLVNKYNWNTIKFWNNDRVFIFVVFGISIFDKFPNDNTISYVWSLGSYTLLHFPIKPHFDKSELLWELNNSMFSPIW